VTDPDSQPHRPRTVFIGSGRFAIASLNALLEHPAIELVGVVTRAPRPAGRGGLLRPSAVGNVARSKWLSLLEPRRLRDEDAIAQVRALQPELLVLADYGQLVPAELLALPAHGALNVHPSLLPRHRGASPIPAAILAADRETGVTIIRMDEGIDSGPIVAQERVDLAGDETAPQLVERLSSLGAELLGRSLGPWISGSITPLPQDESAVTLTRPLRREHGRIDPRRPGVDIARQIRAYQPWPGSFLQTEGGRLIVWGATSVAGAAADSPGRGPDSTARPGDSDVGTLVADDGGLALVVADGTLRLDQVQPAGGRRMTGQELRRGRPALLGTRVIAGAPRPQSAPVADGPSGAASERAR
jgi:methionyl-tRNA formyltransferase